MRISLIPKKVEVRVPFPTLNEISNCVVYTKYPQPHDPMPLPSGGPEYHEDLKAWERRNFPLKEAQVTHSGGCAINEIGICTC